MSQLPIASTSTLLPAYSPTPPSAQSLSPGELLIRAKNHLETLIEGGDIDSRPSRQGKEKQKVGACLACRQAKAKCTGEPGITCPRCLAVPDGPDCVYPTFGRRGRKRGLTPNMIMLGKAHQDVEDALAALTLCDPRSTSRPPPPTSSFPSPTFSTGYPVRSPSSSSDFRPEAGPTSSLRASNSLAKIMESPLAVLAHISSLEETGDDAGTDDEGLDPPVGSSSRSVALKKSLPARYFAGGLYRSLYDSNLDLDPVRLGVLTEADLSRLVTLYFNRMYSYCWHLNPAIHTVKFLRDTSPFLTTVLASQAAGFCPHSAHLVQPLFQHAETLGERIFSQGLKSLEIVQGYLLLLHWQPLAKSSSRDRQWSWLMMALSVATEIRLDKPLDEATYLHYAHTTVLAPDAFALLSADRRKTWIRLFGAEIATCVETGRLSAVIESNIFADQQLANQNLDPNDPDYNLNAMANLNAIYAKALSASAKLYEPEDAPEGQMQAEFNASWQQPMEQWKVNWYHANRWPKLVCQHAMTILLAISMRFKGPAGPILEQCKESATEVVRMALDWPDEIVFANNFIVVNISYAATMLLRLSGHSPRGERIPLDAHVRHLSHRVAQVLQQISDARLHSASIATLHAARLRALLVQLGSDLPAPSPHPLPQPLPSDFLPSQWSAPPQLGGGLIGAAGGDVVWPWPALFQYDAMFTDAWSYPGTGMVMGGAGAGGMGQVGGGWGDEAEAGRGWA